MSPTDDPLPRRAGSQPQMPTVRLSEPEAHVEMIRRLQGFALKHPVAAAAIYSALVTEGEAFARTLEGDRWKHRLARSELVHRARLLLDFPGFLMLERNESQIVPSAFLDTVFLLSTARKPDELLDSLSEWGVG
jgi:hypothetical protein